eukprot:GHRR01013818.1.p1 GENE.GHRR01013818.1~~GHRR01013818.1.p1  ORF type:complete len:289 (+),score=68.67 GHRR01013818.1:453-1319(+)
MPLCRYQVIGVSRNEQLCREATRDLEEEFPGAKISYRVCNLELLSEVEALAQDLLDSGKPINLLINNAARFLDAPFKVTKEGFEQTISIGYYGHVLLTHLLLERLMSSGPARIINVSSPAEQFGTIDWHDMKGTQLGTSGIKAYGRAKLMLLMWTFELQRRLRLTGAPVDAFVVHPGIVSTGLFNKVNFRYPFGALTYLMGVISGQTPLQGAQSTIYAATAPNLSGKGGQYIGPLYTLNILHSYSRHPSNPKAYDVDGWRKLWDTTVQVLQETTRHKVFNLPSVGTRV